MHKLFLWVVMSMALFADSLEIGLEERYLTRDHIRYTLAYDLNETPYMLEERAWEVDKTSFNTLDNAGKAYWVKLELKNITNTSQNYYLKSENQMTFYIKFFLFKNKKLVNSLEDGLIAPNKKRAMNTNHMIFPLELAPKEEAVVFFKIQNYNKIDIHFFLESKEYLLNFYQTYNILEGLFFGGMLIMVFYNLFLYFLFRGRIYLYYVLYTFWISVYFFGLFGFLQRYFPDYIWLFFISSNFFLIFMTLFVQEILNLKQQLPVVNKILNIFILYFLFSGIPYLLSLFMKQFLYVEILFNVFFILLGIFGLLITGITYYLGYIKNDAIAKLYAFIWSIIALGGVVLGAVYLNFLEIDIHIDYIIQVIILCEVLLFAFVLSFKIKWIEEDKSKQEKMFVQQTKLASMGEVISTIAHQWRQPLSEINTIVSTIELDYQNKNLTVDNFDRHLNNIEEVTSYLSKTIHDFMNLFNHNKVLESFCISEVTTASKRLALLSIDEDIKFSCDIEDIQMLGYKSELVHALLIVINNAVEACRNQNSVSQITIRIKSISMNIVIEVEDNGGGIEKKILKDIFNPYFTTKNETDGIGLGLYILKMIIEGSMFGELKIKNVKNGVMCQMIVPLNLEKRGIR